MEQLDKLWIYQLADLAVDKVEALKRALPVRQQQLKLRKELEEYRAQLERVEREVEVFHQRLTVLTQELQELEIDFGRDRAEMANVEDGEHAINLRQNAHRLLNIMSEREHELEGMVKANADNDRKIRSIVGRYNKGKTMFEELKTQYETEAEAINEANRDVYAQRDEAAKEIEQALLQKYKNIKTNKPNVMVKLNGEQCGGCNMSLAAVVVKTVAEGNAVVECENCGRIIYSKAV